MRPIVGRGPVWECEGGDPNHSHVLGAHRVVLVFPTRSHDRCAIPSCRPSYAFDDLTTTGGLGRQNDGSLVDPALAQERPYDAGHLVRQGDGDEHARLALKHTR